MSAQDVIADQITRDCDPKQILDALTAAGYTLSRHDELDMRASAVADLAFISGGGTPHDRIARAIRAYLWAVRTGEGISWADALNAAKKPPQVLAQARVALIGGSADDEHDALLECVATLESIYGVRA